MEKRLRELKIKKNYLQEYSHQVHLQEVSVSTGREQSHLFKKVWRRPIGTPFSETRQKEKDLNGTSSCICCGSILFLV